MAAISPPAPVAEPHALAPAARPAEPAIAVEPATAVAVASRSVRLRSALATTGRTLVLCAIVLLVPGEAGKIGPSLGRD